MIIQAGFDFEILARPFTVQDGKLMPRPVVICVDAEMRLNSVDVIAEDSAGSLTPLHDSVLAVLDPDYTKYFAIAHPGRFSEYDFSDPIEDEACELESKAADRGFQLIGHLALDETGYMPARARSYFDPYPGDEDLPGPCTTGPIRNSVSVAERLSTSGLPAGARPGDSPS